MDWGYVSVKEGLLLESSKELGFVDFPPNEGFKLHSLQSNIEFGIIYYRDENFTVHTEFLFSIYLQYIHYI